MILSYTLTFVPQTARSFFTKKKSEGLLNLFSIYVFSIFREYNNTENISGSGYVFYMKKYKK